MQVKLALLADAANVSGDGKLNILGIFDTIYAREFPTTHPSMHLVLRFEAPAAEAGGTRALEVVLVAPDGAVLFRVPGTLTLQRGEAGRVVGIDHVLALANVAFARPGVYEFRILLADEAAVTVPLRVQRLPPQH